MPSNHVPSRKGNSGGAYLKTFLEQLGGSGPEGWGDRLFLEGGEGMAEAKAQDPSR